MAAVPWLFSKNPTADFFTHNIKGLQAEKNFSIMTGMKGGGFMSSSKASIIEKLNHISDDMNEEEIIERLYMLMRLEHSRNRCDEEGVYSDEEVAEHFAAKRKKVTQI